METIHGGIANITKTAPEKTALENLNSMLDKHNELFGSLNSRLYSISSRVSAEHPKESDSVVKPEPPIPPFNEGSLSDYFSKIKQYEKMLYQLEYHINKLSSLI